MGNILYSPHPKGKHKRSSALQNRLMKEALRDMYPSPPSPKARKKLHSRKT